MKPAPQRRSRMRGFQLLAPLGLCFSIGCASNTNCLSGALAPSYAEREDLQLLQREYERAEQAPPTLRARLLEPLPELFPDLSNRSLAPQCAREFLSVLSRDLEQRPLAFNRASFHQLQALARVADTTDVMPDKARILLGLARVGSDDVLPYAMAEGEQGAPPTLERLRHSAIAVLTGSNLYLNDARVRAFLDGRVLQALDDREQLLLVSQTRLAPWRTDRGQALVPFWLADAKQRLQGSPTPVSQDLLLARVTTLGAYATRLGKTEEVLQLYDTIIDAEGQLPVTRGSPGAARDLVLRTMLARAHVQDTEPRVSWQDPELPFLASSPATREQLGLEEPTRMQWPRELVQGRLRQLDADFQSSNDKTLRCWLLRQRSEWTPRPQSEAYFHALLGNQSDSCAQSVALAMNHVPLGQRVKTVTRALTETRAPWLPASQAWVLRLAVSKQPSWIEQSQELRQALARDALLEHPERLWHAPRTISSLGLMMGRLRYQHILDRTLRQLATSTAQHERALAKELVSHWLRLLHASRSGPLSDLPTFQLRRALFFAVAEFAPKLGLEAEAAALIEQGPVANYEAAHHDRVLARWLFERGAR